MDWRFPELPSQRGGVGYSLACLLACSLAFWKEILLLGFSAGGKGRAGQERVGAGGVGLAASSSPGGLFFGRVLRRGVSLLPFTVL